MHQEACRHLATRLLSLVAGPLHNSLKRVKNVKMTMPMTIGMEGEGVHPSIFRSFSCHWTSGTWRVSRKVLPVLRIVFFTNARRSVKGRAVDTTMGNSVCDVDTYLAPGLSSLFFESCKNKSPSVALGK